MLNSIGFGKEVDFGVKYTKHGLERRAQRGYSNEDVEEIIESGDRSAGKYPGTTYHTLDRDDNPRRVDKVVTSNDNRGAVVTLFSEKKRSK